MHSLAERVATGDIDLDMLSNVPARAEGMPKQEHVFGRGRALSMTSAHLFLQARWFHRVFSAGQARAQACSSGRLICNVPRWDTRDRLAATTLSRSRLAVR